MNDSHEKDNSPRKSSETPKSLPSYDEDGSPLKDEENSLLQIDYVTQRKPRNANDRHSIENSSVSQPLVRNSYDFYVKINYQAFYRQDIISSREITVPFGQPDIKLPSAQQLFDELLNRNEHNNSITDWTLSTPSDLINMGAVPIEVIVGMIPEYDGEEHDLDIYLNKIDRLWKHIEDNPAADKSRFMLMLQIHLYDKAAHATKDVDFDEWAPVRKALKDNINPQKNIEKAELKLTAAKQMSNEDVEAFATRVNGLLDNLNKSFCLEVENDILKKENDRKARKAFENGLFNTELRTRAITRGNKTFRESVDYVIEQELRNVETRRKPVTEKICTYCLTPNHEAFECRKRLNRQNPTVRTPRVPPIYHNSQSEFPNPNYRRSIPNELPNREVSCYFCNQRGHYASQCPARNNRNSMNPPDNRSNSVPNSPRRSYNNPNSPTRNPNEFDRRSINHNRPSTSNASPNPRESINPRNVHTCENEISLEEAIALATEVEETKN